jgi:hypothetical protein
LFEECVHEAAELVVQGGDLRRERRNSEYANEAASVTVKLSGVIVVVLATRALPTKCEVFGVPSALGPVQSPETSGTTGETFSNRCSAKYCVCENGA